MENLYYGKAIHDREDFSHFHEELMRSPDVRLRSGAGTFVYALYPTGIPGVRHGRL